MIEREPDDETRCARCGWMWRSHGLTPPHTITGDALVLRCEGFIDPRPDPLAELEKLVAAWDAYWGGRPAIAPTSDADYWRNLREADARRCQWESAIAKARAVIAEARKKV